MTCFACNEAAAFEVGPALGCCSSCAKRIAAIAARSPAGVWAQSGPPAAAHAPPRPVDVDTDALFDAFQKGIAKQIATADSETHLNLAEAYAEMGLFADARREAAHVVLHAERAQHVRTALQILLAPPVLEPGGLERLRRELKMD